MSESKEVGKVGRPTACTEEVANEICVRLAGGETLRSICKDTHMPAISSVLLWVVDGKHEDFAEQYLLAREAQCHFDADRIRDVINKVGNGTLAYSNGNVMINGLKWCAERSASKRYAPHKSVDVDHTTGGNTFEGRAEHVVIEVVPGEFGEKTGEQKDNKK